MTHCSQKCVACFYSERLPLKEEDGNIIRCCAWKDTEENETRLKKDWKIVRFLQY